MKKKYWPACVRFGQQAGWNWTTLSKSSSGKQLPFEDTTTMATTQPDHDTDDREFTDEQLRAALKRVGEDAQTEAFAAGRPVYILKGNTVVALHADGTEEIV